MSAHDRIDDLLAQRALVGLDESAWAELESLLIEHPERADDQSFDLAAAALDLALAPPAEPLPEQLRGRLLASAPRFMKASTSSDAMPVQRRSLAALPTPTTREPGRTEPRRDRSRSRAWIGFAIAASLAVVAVLDPAGWRRESVPPARVQRDALLASTDLRPLPWSATEDAAAAGATGDVVWSDELQQGFMRIRGLASNDPRVAQYQLWVFDATRDARYPVDGGVFDIPADGDEVVVPIDARVPVREATLFAVTVEPPGGVVVSTRDRVVLVASAGD